MNDMKDAVGDWSFREAQKLKIIQGLRLFDDALMTEAFDQQLPETECLLRVILDRDDISVTSCKTQYYLSNVYGHEVRLDILASDTNGKAYNVEVQQLLKGIPAQRTRYYAAILDSSLLGKGKPYEVLPERYTIFITEDDPFQQGFPTYHIENTIQEMDHAPFGDGGHIIYVNGQYRNLKTPIGRLIHDFSCSRPEDMQTPILRERIQYLKQQEGGIRKMNALLENWIREDHIDLAEQELRVGELTMEQIARVTQLPLSLIKDLAAKMAATQSNPANAYPD